MPFVDLEITHAGVVPATIYTFGKIVIGQQLEVLKKENAELERGVIANLVAQPSYKYEKLAFAKQASEQLKNPQILDDEFGRQSGLPKTNWNKLTPAGASNSAFGIRSNLERMQLGHNRGFSHLAFQCSKQPLHVVLFKVKLMCRRRG